MALHQTFRASACATRRNWRPPGSRSPRLSCSARTRSRARKWTPSAPGAHQLEASVVAAKATEGTARLNLSLHPHRGADQEGRVGPQRRRGQPGRHQRHQRHRRRSRWRRSASSSRSAGPCRLAALPRRRLLDGLRPAPRWTVQPRWTTRSTRRPAPCAPRRGSSTRAAASFSSAERAAASVIQNAVVVPCLRRARAAAANTCSCTGTIRR